MPKFRVLQQNVVPFARNVDEVVEIASPSVYQKYMEQKAIEPLEKIEKPVTSKKSGTNNSTATKKRTGAGRGGRRS